MVESGEWMKDLDKFNGKRIFLKTLDHVNVSSDYVLWMMDSEILKFLTGRTVPYSQQELSEYILKMNESATDILFGIFLIETQVHIGNIKIGDIDYSDGTAHVGMLIGSKAMWGKGYATEAIELVTRYGFDKLSLKKLRAGMVVDNIGSFKAFMKAGYTQIGKTNKQVFLNGQYVDSIKVEIER